jgi:glycosyltransferase involved in cell wall biosynthesis
MADKKISDKNTFVLVVVPCLNEEQTIGDVVANIPRSMDGVGRVEVLVFDDGSSDATAERAREAGAEVVSHATNQGLGATFRDAVGIAIAKGADIMVHIDHKRTRRYGHSVAVLAERPDPGNAVDQAVG